MKKLFIAACAAGMSLSLASCGTQRKAASTTAALNGEWKITTVEGQAIQAKPGEKEAFIGFDVKENRIYGNTGCNNLTGGLQADAKKGTISFGQTGSTRMMCADMGRRRNRDDARKKVKNEKQKSEK